MAIILPIYNAECYIEDCLNSILAQTYSNWTAYCVDDGSNDRSQELLDDFARKDKRFKVFHIPNQGASNARNFALEKLENAEWISFVDADIILHLPCMKP